MILFSHVFAILKAPDLLFEKSSCSVSYSLLALETMHLSVLGPIFFFDCCRCRTCRTIYFSPKKQKSPKSNAITTKKIRKTKKKNRAAKSSCLMCSAYPFVFSFLLVMTTEPKEAAAVPKTWPRQQQRNGMVWS